MRRDEGVVALLRRLIRFLEEEASRDPAFAERLGALLVRAGQGGDRVRPTRRRGASPPVPDVLTALQQKGEAEFRFWLRDFDLPILRAIVKANGFDAAKASQRWKEPDKFIALIVDQARARLSRGASFLPPPTPPDAP